MSRLRNGRVLHRFGSELPGGSRWTCGDGGGGHCILDCVFHEARSATRSATHSAARTRRRAAAAATRNLNLRQQVHPA